ncbi:lytic transglycosylase [Xenorhabdus sp. ZM]|uniref:lytic transglycosylase n=1 Tax=Xenorhabdus szentirmaii TaxID=290112 RepID=UPI0019AC61B8|nr:lytic transglycosylase [Xenorhabdus sp. ZM]MBD2803499.1 lytic transglycosylase [Xenorhabdus sp. ZM]
MSNTNAETIRDFLISLGFDIDNASEQKFNSMVAGVTANVLKLGAAVEGAALAVVGFTAQVANGLDKLYWQAQRTGGAVEQIKSLGYAVSQAGGTVEGLNSSLEGVAKFLRNNPGGEGFLRNMSIQTRDANGKLRDTASLVALVGERLSALPMYRANQYASILGIDENTLMAMRRGIGGYASDYHRIIKTLGYNPEVASQHANAFMTQMYQLKLVMGSAKEKVGGELARVLTPSVEKFTKYILANWPAIEKIIMSVVKAILTMSEILGQLVFRGAKGIQDLIGWWKQLDDGSQNLIKMFGLVAAAWWALNSKFIKSPIGIITALLAALFLLYDDYQGWKEGKNSFIDWGKWEGTIKKIKTELTELTTGFKELGKEITELFGIDPKTWSLKFEFEDLSKSLGELSKTLSHLLAALNHLNDGNFTLAWEELKLAWHGDEQNKRDVRPVGIDAAERHRETILGGYFYLNNKLNEFLPEWLGGTPSQAKASSNQAKGNTRGERNNNPLNMNFAKQRHAVLEDGKGARFAKFNTIYNGLERTAWQLRRYFNGQYDGIKRQSVEMIVKKWSPREDNNDTEAYIERVSKRLGVGRRDHLDLNNHDVMYALMNAMSPEEIGKPLPYDKRLVMAAIAGTPVPTNALAKNSSFNFDPKMFDNAMANISNMVGNIDPRIANNAQANISNMMRQSAPYTPELLRAGADVAHNQTTIEQNLTIHVNGVESPREAAALTSEAVQRNNAILVRSLQTKVS